MERIHRPWIDEIVTSFLEGRPDRPPLHERSLSSLNPRGSLDCRPSDAPRTAGWACHGPASRPAASSLGWRPSSAAVSFVEKVLAGELPLSRRASQDPVHRHSRLGILPPPPLVDRSSLRPQQPQPPPAPLPRRVLELRPAPLTRIPAGPASFRSPTLPQPVGRHHLAATCSTAASIAAELGQAASGVPPAGHGYSSPPLHADEPPPARTAAGVPEQPPPFRFPALPIPPTPSPPLPEPWPSRAVAASRGAAAPPAGPPPPVPHGPAPAPPPAGGVRASPPSLLSSAPLSAAPPPADPRTICHMGCEVRSHEERSRDRSRRADTLNPAPPVPCPLAPPPPALAGKRSRGAKGWLHAASCAGPWVAALDRMPEPIPVGAKRARLGLADTPLRRSDQHSVESERAARALVAILPFASAPWLLSSSEATIRAMRAADVAEELVDRLRVHNAGSLNGAYSALGRLLTFVRSRYPLASQLEGVHLSAWQRETSPSPNSLASLAWIRDHAGLVTHARAPVAAPWRGSAATGDREKAPFTLAVVVALEWIAVFHPCPFVRGQAAGWLAAARSALRIEQAASCVINAVAPVTADGTTALVIFGSVVREKHPDRTKQTPRPFFGIAEGINHGARSYDALCDMLDGRADVRALIIDTDSPSGDPRAASRWVSAPLAPGARASASLHALLEIAGFDRASAGRLLGHGAQRFLMAFTEASPLFSPEHSSELARFAGSTSKDADLTPTQAMLARHAVRSAVLPAIYSGKEKVRSVAVTAVRVHAAIVSTVKAAAASGDPLALHSFACARAPTAPAAQTGEEPPLLLLH
jgi:hypothetical protein